MKYMHDNGVSDFCDQMDDLRHKAETAIQQMKVAGPFKDELDQRGKECQKLRGWVATFTLVVMLRNPVLASGPVRRKKDLKQQMAQVLELVESQGLGVPSSTKQRAKDAI